MIIIEENSLDIDGKTVLFEDRIKEAIEINNVVVVLLQLSKDKYTNGIYGVKDGRIAWRVQDMIEYNANYAPFAPDSYTGI